MKSARRQRGFGLVSAIFLLVVLAAAGAIMLNLAGVQRSTSSQALQGVRAYHAARSGIEWGVWQALSTGACPAPASFTLTEGGLVGFDVSVTCTSSTHVESATTASVYRVVSVAQYASLGAPDHVRRRLQATFNDGP